MARKREGAVRESAEELEVLLERCDNDSQRTRARMLLELRATPQLTYDELAGRLGYHEKTFRRWWSVYRAEGLGSLMRMGDGGATRATMTYTYTRLEPEPRLVPLRLMRFLNSLPTTLETHEWARRFKESLESILDGVDRVTVGIDIGSDLEHTGEHRPAVMVTHHRSSRSDEIGETVTSRRVGRSPGETFVEQMIAGGFPVEEYARPHHFDYFLDDREWLGTIVLWRRRHRDPIPQRTLELLRSLEPFMVFLFSDGISRRVRRDPQIRVFQDVVRAVATHTALTRRELEVFSLQVIGKSRREIAETLRIVVGTVDKHIGEIHRKAGTRNYSELFARYFAPLGSE